MAESNDAWRRYGGGKIIIGCWRVVPIFTTSPIQQKAQREILKNIQSVQDRRKFDFSIANTLFTIRYEVEYISPTLDQVLILTLSACVESYNAVWNDRQIGAPNTVQQEFSKIDEFEFNKANSTLSMTLQQLPHLVPIKDITTKLQEKICELIVENAEAKKQAEHHTTVRESIKLNFLDVFFNKEVSQGDDIAVQLPTKSDDETDVHDHWQRLSRRNTPAANQAFAILKEEDPENDPRQDFNELFVIESAPHHHSKYLTPKDLDYCEWQSGEAGISYPTRTLSTIEFQEIDRHPRNVKSSESQRLVSNYSMYAELTDEEFRQGLTVGFVHIINFGSLSNVGGHTTHPHVQKKVDKSSLPLLATVWNNSTSASTGSNTTATVQPHQAGFSSTTQTITYAITLHELFSHKLRCIWKLKDFHNKVQCVASKLVYLRRAATVSAVDTTASPKRRFTTQIRRSNNDENGGSQHQEKKTPLIARSVKKECFVLLILGFENGDIGTIEVPITNMDALSSIPVDDKTLEIEVEDVEEKSLTMIKPVSSCKMMSPKIHNKEISSIRVEGDKVYVCSFDKSFSILQININLMNEGHIRIDEREPYNSVSQNDVTSSNLISLTCVDRPLSQDHFTNNLVHHDVILAIVPFPFSSPPSNSQGPFNGNKNRGVDQHNLYQSHNWNQLFTSSWDTKIRYWKRELAAVHVNKSTEGPSTPPENQNHRQQYESKWISFALPAEHSKRVGCLAIYDFSSRHRQFTHHIGGVGMWSRVLVSGSMDTTAIIWDISNPMRPMKVRQLQGHEREVVDVKILPHDYEHMPMVVTASADKTIRCWDMICGQVFRLLPHDQGLFNGGFDILRLDRTNKPSGDILVSVSQHGHALAVWNFLANHRQTRQFTDAVSCLAVLCDDQPRRGVADEMSSSNNDCPENDTFDQPDPQFKRNLAAYKHSSNRSTNDQKHVPIIIGTYLGKSVISIKGKTRQILDDSNTVLRSLPSFPSPTQSVLKSTKVSSEKQVVSTEEHPKEKNGIRYIDFSRTVPTSSTDDISSSHEDYKDREGDLRPSALESVVANTRIHSGSSKGWTASAPSVSVRVSSIATYHNAQTGTSFIIVGLLNGMISVWMRDRPDGEYNKRCFFQDNKKGVFVVAVYDPCKGHALNSPEDDCIEQLILVGGISDCPHAWSLNELVKHHGFIANVSFAKWPSVTSAHHVRAASFESRSADDDIFANLERANSASIHTSNFKTGTIRSLLIHYLPKMGLPTIFVTGDFQSKTIVWRVKDLMPLVVLEGLHKTDSVFALSLYDPTSIWKTFEAAADYNKNDVIDDEDHLGDRLSFDSTARERLLQRSPVPFSFSAPTKNTATSGTLHALPQNFLQDHDMDHIAVDGHKYALKSTLFVISGGYDGNVGLWPIDIDMVASDSWMDLRVLSSDSSVKEVSHKLSAQRNVVMERAWSAVPKLNTFSRMHHENQESVTSMTLFVPQQQSKQGVFSSSSAPLIITGSIDHLIYVWNLFTQEKIHVLTGHSGRITSLLVYHTRSGTKKEQDLKHPILVSGSDDCCTTYWEDGLQHHCYPPSRSVLLRTFYKDVEFHNQNNCQYGSESTDNTGHLNSHGQSDEHENKSNNNKQLWKQMKLLRSMYPKTNFYMEFPHIFYLALIERQETFFLEFLDDLQAVLTRIPPYKRYFSLSNGWQDFVSDRVDILEYAMTTNSLVALRALLFSWQRVLNEDIQDSLSQKLLLACRMFSADNLIMLAKDFPVEYADFLCSLRLVKLHPTAESVDGKLFQTLPTLSRQRIIGSNEFLITSNNQHKNRFGRFFSSCGEALMMSLQGLLQTFISSSSTQQGLLPGKSQSVTAFLLPIKGFADIAQFSSVVNTCDLLNNRLDLFQSPIVTIAITHYWSVHGWKVYFLQVLQYLFTLGFFVFCIYSFQYATAINQTGSGAVADEAHLAIIRAKRAHFAFLVLMALYALDEFCKLVGTKRLKQMKSPADHVNQKSTERRWPVQFRNRISIYYQLLIGQYVGNLWNTTNIVVIVSAILGSLIRYDVLLYFDSYDSHVKSSRDNLSSCILAITAVALWFKILYFLRPIKTAGQFVAMVCTIINDIKYFLFVLVCVLTGFSQGFWLLLNNASVSTASASSSSFQSIKMSYFSTIMFMFGEINSDDLEGSKSLAFTRFFLVAFMLTMMILMLNLLIALMGDSFARTKENIEKIYWKELASMMIDQSMPTLLLSCLEVLQILRYEKDEFIHVVKYTSDLRQDDSATVLLKQSQALEKSFSLCKQQYGDNSCLPIKDESLLNQGCDILDRDETTRVGGVRYDFWL